MTDPDAHILHTWLLTNGPDEITIDLWTDGYTVHVDGGPDDGDQREGGHADVDHLLTTYRANGYRLIRDYPVNEAAADIQPVEDAEPEPDGRPEECPDCGSPVGYEPHHEDSLGRVGSAWLCTGCKWGEWITE